ncbi:hypothetical protein UFOVP238_53 [uncultured Caudovirales phage]|uniref:Uncharacterized protein n=1 Tax=uncultured Caudovirales phage TaxID=2100421 RepID=A0A6J7WWC3_9CAUD|nr:hypothetical protein UFOVP238_53 [uncultured Caudovirales phage]
MKITSTIEGVTKTVANMSNLKTASTMALVQGLYLEGERVMADSKNNYVPVVSGALKGSGRVSKPQLLQDGKWEIRLTFGNAATLYALEVHERPKSIGQHKNKYLQKPFKASLPALDNRIRDWLKVLK